MSLKPRDLIIDNFGRKGLIVEACKPPTASWLSDQEDFRVRKLPADTVWWRVLPIKGGSVIVPEPLTRFVRDGNVRDALSAIKHANAHALGTIAQVFPEVVNQAWQYQTTEWRSMVDTQSS